MEWHVRGGRRVDQSISVGNTPRGTEVIVESMPYLHTVALSVTATVGSRDERKRESGVSHFLEHMLFRGTESMGFREVNERIEASGGYLNAYTTHEFTCYYAFTIDESLKVAEDLLADLFLHPLMDPALVELERNIIKQEIGMRMNDPSSHLRTRMNEALYKGNPLSRSILGTPSSLDHFDSRFLREYHRSHYHPPHVVVCAVGNVDPRRVMEWATRFDDVEGKAAPKGRRTPKQNTGTHFFTKESDRAYLGIGLPAYPAPHPRAMAQSLLTTILCGGTSSRLNHRIREVEGLVYGINMYPLAFRDCGSLLTYCSTSLEQVPRLFDSFGQELARLKGEGLEAGELEKAKLAQKGSLLRNACRPDQNMSSHLHHFLDTGKVQSIEEHLEEINSVTEEEVMRAALDILRRERVCTTICAGQGMKEKMMEAAASLDF
ncbi:MAG: insulinase family protein [Methanomassiliicoccales archaeon]|nr:insulinase family protein [Methanomassiliicoccales archaeon]